MQKPRVRVERVLLTPQELNALEKIYKDQPEIKKDIRKLIRHIKYQACLIVQYRTEILNLDEIIALGKRP